MSKKNAGFTLVEVLIALSILLLLASLSIFLLNPQLKHLAEKDFFTTLQSDLYFAQSYAISHHNTLKVVISPSAKKYTITKGYSSALLIERKYEEYIVINQDAKAITFSIRPNGNLTSPMTITIHIKNQEYKFTIQLGKGKFYVTKM